MNDVVSLDWVTSVFSPQRFRRSSTVRDEPFVYAL
jgi:hypothetical protein